LWRVPHASSARSAGAGHYSSYVQHPVSLQWFNMNDGEVTRVDVTHVQQAQAYMLFYNRRRDT
jgi:ubiquitin C-terminal hydrolase